MVTQNLQTCVSLPEVETSLTKDWESCLGLQGGPCYCSPALYLFIRRRAAYLNWWRHHTILVGVSCTFKSYVVHEPENSASEEIFHQMNSTSIKYYILFYISYQTNKLYHHNITGSRPTRKFVILTKKVLVLTQSVPRTSSAWYTLPLLRLVREEPSSPGPLQTYLRSGAVRCRCRRQCSSDTGRG